MTIEIGPNLLCVAALAAGAGIVWRWLSIRIVQAQNEAPETIHIHHGGENSERY